MATAGNDERDYLMIENPGTVGMGLLTILGASGSRGRESQIGQFGSGTKQSIALLLRRGVKTTLFSGKNGFKFGTKLRYEKDARDQQVPIYEVVMEQIAGDSKKTTNLGFDVGMGSIDWTRVGMAIREFISNAADASLDLTGGYGDVNITYVFEKDIKGVEGKTRVFVERTEEIDEYVRDIRTNFLIFDRDWDRERKVLPKRSRHDPVRIYRKGVLVYEGEGECLFNYNLNDISLNESREIRFNDARYGVSEAIKHADSETLHEFLTAVKDRRPVFEVKDIDPYTLGVDYNDDTETVTRITETWNEAFKAVYGDKGILCDTTFGETGVARKGYEPVRVGPALRSALATFQLPTSDSVLSHAEQNGREILPLTEGQTARMTRIWDKLVALGVTDGRKMPPLEGFTTFMKETGTTEAYFDPMTGKVGMSTDVLDDDGHRFPAIAVEEYAHAVTGASDETRMLQDWAFRVIGLLMKEMGL